MTAVPIAILDSFTLTHPPHFVAGPADEHSAPPKSARPTPGAGRSQTPGPGPAPVAGQDSPSLGA